MQKGLINKQSDADDIPSVIGRTNEASGRWSARKEKPEPFTRRATLERLATSIKRASHIDFISEMPSNHFALASRSLSIFGGSSMFFFVFAIIGLNTHAGPRSSMTFSTEKAKDSLKPVLIQSADTMVRELLVVLVLFQSISRLSRWCWWISQVRSWAGSEMFSIHSHDTLLMLVMMRDCSSELGDVLRRPEGGSCMHDKGRIAVMMLNP